jgi:hypothetical protein
MEKFFQTTVGWPDVGAQRTDAPYLELLLSASRAVVLESARSGVPRCFPDFSHSFSD